MLKKIFLSTLIFLAFTRVIAQDTQVQVNADLAFRTGLELLAREKYAAAQNSFDQYLSLGKKDQLSIEAEYYSAVCALYLFNPDAERKFHRFIKRYPEHPKAILAYYDLGAHYFSQRNYKQTIEYLEKVDIKKLDAETRLERDFKLGYAYFFEKNFEKAGALFDGIKNGNHKYVYASNYYSGFSNYKVEKYDVAEKDFKKAGENEAYKPLVPVMLMNIYYKNKKYQDMLTYVQTIENEGIQLKSGEEFYLLAADAAYRLEDYAKAVALMDKSGGSSKMQGDTLYRYAYAQYKTDKLPEAITNFQKLSVLNNKLGQYSAYYMGMSYLKQGNKPFALNAFTTAYGYGKDSLVTPSSMFYAGKLNFDLGKYHDAAQIFRTFVRKFPADTNRTDASELFGEALLNSNNLDEAIVYIEGLRRRSERVNKAYQKVTVFKGIELFNANDYVGALAMFKKSLEYRYDRELADMANFWSGETYSIDKKYNESIESYEAISRVSEYSLKSKYGLGYNYYNLKKYDQALKYFRDYTDQPEKISNKKNLYDAQIRLADCYYAAKKYNDALAIYNELLNKNHIEEIDYAIFQKAAILAAKGDFEEAISNYDLVIKRYPDSRFYDNALYQKAELNFEKGHYQSATEGFTMLLHERPNSQLASLVLLKRALANDNLKNFDLAAGDYKRILQDYPLSKDAKPALEGLQEVLSKLDKSEEFETVLSDYKQRNPDDTGLEGLEYSSAKSLYNNGKYPQAVRSFTNYINVYASSDNIIDARYFLADSYLRTKDTSNAYTWFGEVVNQNKGNYVNRSLRAKADIELSRQNYQSSKSSYSLWLSRVVSKKEQINAWMGLMDCFYGLKDCDSTIYFGQKILDAGNASINASNKANLVLAKCYLTKGDNIKADEYLLQLLNSAQDEYAAEANYLVAENHYLMKDYKNSLDKLFGFNEHFGSNVKWLGKSYLLIADNYIALGEAFQAKATLKSIIEKFPDKETVEAARKKMDTLTSDGNTTEEEEGAEDDE